MSKPSGSAKAGTVALTLGALGVVFGDIGTSPLYALQTVFSTDNHIVRPTEAGVYGVISLVFWAITIIVSLKYLTFIMRADNNGEGGIMALIALLQTLKLRRRVTKMALVALGVFGASLYYGDGMITPAISVLSAVEGVKVATPGLGPRATASRSSSTTARLRSSRSAPSSSSSRVPRRCTPTWATSAGRRSAGRGSWPCSRR